MVVTELRDGTYYATLELRTAEPARGRSMRGRATQSRSRCARARRSSCAITSSSIRTGIGERRAPRRGIGAIGRAGADEFARESRARAIARPKLRRMRGNASLSDVRSRRRPASSAQRVLAAVRMAHVLIGTSAVRPATRDGGPRPDRFMDGERESRRAVPTRRADASGAGVGARGGLRRAHRRPDQRAAREERAASRRSSSSPRYARRIQRGPHDRRVDAQAAAEPDAARLPAARARRAPARRARRPFDA